ncbi:MAG: DNA polymerase III subunit gamma/tau, partial [Gemmataceae bacterium]
MAKKKSAASDKAQTPGIVAASAPDTSGTDQGYTVLARRYRPQSFGELLGQEPVARALSNALTGNRVAHAYLFTGARGVGKTSTARILAKALNCENGPTPNPCNQCSICQSIATGEDVDVLEIDGASNNGVDDVRDIRSNVQYRPQRARFKIYIIDEVHMLSKGAFNALLKTLEEPPPHVKFIFATTEVEKIPITILSRCQRFDFVGIPLARIVQRLEEIAQKEKVVADSEALEMVARRAGGSMRDAQSLFDQLLAFGEDRLTADQVHHLLGTAGDDRILGLAESILKDDSAQALTLLEEACVSGLQLGELVDQLIAYWRDLMVVQCGGVKGRDLSMPPRHHETVQRHSAMIPLDAILAGLDVLSACKARLRGSNHSRTLVEMAVIRLGRLAHLLPVAQLIQVVSEAGGQTPVPASSVRHRMHSHPASASSGQPEPEKKNLIADLSTGSEPPVSRPPLSPANWPELSHLLEAALGKMLSSELAKAGPPAISGPNTLVFSFPAGYNQAKEFVQKPERLSRVEEAIQKETGHAWKIQ